MSVFIIIIFFFVSLFWRCHMASGYLDTLTRDWIQAPAVRTPSPNHWTTREFLTFTSIVSFNSHYSMRLISLFPFYRWWNWGSKRKCDSLKIRQLVSSSLGFTVRQFNPRGRKRHRSKRRGNLSQMKVLPIVELAVISKLLLCSLLRVWSVTLQPRVPWDTSEVTALSSETLIVWARRQAWTQTATHQGTHVAFQGPTREDLGQNNPDPRFRVGMLGYRDLGSKSDVRTLGWQRILFLVF